MQEGEAGMMFFEHTLDALGDFIFLQQDLAKVGLSLRGTNLTAEGSTATQQFKIVISRAALENAAFNYEKSHVPGTSTLVFKQRRVDSMMPRYSASTRQLMARCGTSRKSSYSLSHMRRISGKKHSNADSTAERPPRYRYRLQQNRSLAPPPQCPLHRTRQRYPVHNSNWAHWHVYATDAMRARAVRPTVATSESELQPRWSRRQRARPMLSPEAAHRRPPELFLALHQHQLEAEPPLPRRAPHPPLKRRAAGRCRATRRWPLGDHPRESLPGRLPPPMRL